jgi:hypothetical protein
MRKTKILIRNSKIPNRKIKIPMGKSAEAIAFFKIPMRKSADVIAFSKILMGKIGEVITLPKIPNRKIKIQEYPKNCVNSFLFTHLLLIACNCGKATGIYKVNRQEYRAERLLGDFYKLRMFNELKIHFYLNFAMPCGTSRRADQDKFTTLYSYIC